MTKVGSKNRFVVDLGDLALKPSEQRAVAAAIQGAVLSYLSANHELPSQQAHLMDDGGIAGMFMPPAVKPSAAGPSP